MKLLNTRTNTLWRYNGYYKRKISEKNRIFLQSEATKLQEFNGILLKRDDQSVLGSHKFRPLTYQVACLLEDGIKRCTISSSGNAAITLSHLPIKSYIFISPNTPLEKKQNIVEIDEANQTGAIVFESGKAPRFSNYLSKKASIPQLRPSKDDNAIEGYKSLGFELYEENPWIDAIFFFITSGASLLGVYEAYKSLLVEGDIQKMPALHAVLGSDIEDGSAGVCTQTKMHRDKQIKQSIKETHGATWSVTNQELEATAKELKEAGIISSYESYAAYIACQKARANYKNPVVIFSGKKWERKSKQSNSNFRLIADFDALDEIIQNMYNL